MTLFVDTPLLRVGYEVAGPADGFPVVLVHGWPDDVRTWDRVLPALHREGYRTYVPWLRGYGPTAFRSTMRPAPGSWWPWVRTSSTSSTRSASAGMRWSGTTGARAPRTSPRR